MTSVTSLAFNIISKTYVKNDAVLLKEYISKMKNCVHILPYLGQEKYKDLLEETEKYNTGG